MDQVRTIAMAVWQQRFWVLSGIGMIVALVCWNSATTDLEKRFSTRKSAIEGSFGTVSSITNEAFHPNNDVIKGNTVQVEAQKAIVGKLWSDLYEQQRTEVLFWPKLGDGFADRMATKKFRDPIDSNMRGLYRNYIKNQFTALREIVKASKNAQGNRRGGPGQFYGGQGQGGAGGETTTEPVVENYLVQWLDQATLQGRLEFASMPSDTKVWVTQEDIWVYKTLLSVIAKTNQLHGATRPDNTAISTIVQLQVGKDAASGKQTSPSVYIPSASSLGGVDGGQGGQGYEQQAGGGQGGYEGGEYGLPGAGESDTAILADRYLNEEGETYSGDSGDFGTEYRKLPIRMVLKMDQRMLPIVLVECANATLPIEVTQVSVNSLKSNTSGFSGITRRNNQRSGFASANTTDLRVLSEVEIQGVVLIYEQPDESVLPSAETPTT